MLVENTLKCKTTPKCFGSRRNHHQGAEVSAQRATHTHNGLEYAAIALATKHINKYAGTVTVILARH